MFTKCHLIFLSPEHVGSLHFLASLPVRLDHGTCSHQWGIGVSVVIHPQL